MQDKEKVKVKFKNIFGSALLAGLCFGLVLVWSMPVRAEWYMRNGVWRFSQNGKDLHNFWILDPDNVFYYVDGNGNYTGVKEAALPSPYPLEPSLLNRAYGMMADLGYDGDSGGYYGQALSYINGERAKHGQAPLTLDRNLSMTATYRGMDMYQYSYFSHQKPGTGGEGHNDIVGRIMSGDPSFRSGENIYTLKMSYSHALPGMDSQTVKGFIGQGNQAYTASSGHYANMINGMYTRVGIGLNVIDDAATKTRYFYYTQIFR